jgi:hypothetical protein
MNDFNEDPNPVTRQLVAEDQRLSIIENLFGAHFPLMLEPIIYGITERMAELYKGGDWNFYTLDNGGFYLAPKGDEVYQVNCDNHFTGELSADVLGICACLYAYSHCSFSQDEAFGRLCAQHYHLLRAYMLDHVEAASILGATD